MSFKKRKNKWRYFLITVTLIVAISLGVWVYFGDILENIIFSSQFYRKKDNQNYFSSKINLETLSLKIGEEEITNWKTFNNENYNNQKYKYEIKYPQEFEIFQSSNGTAGLLISDHQINFSTVIDWQEEMMRPGLYLEFFDSGKVSFKNWLKEIWGINYVGKMSLFDVKMDLDDLNNMIEKREGLNINNYKAIKLLPSPFKPPEFIFIYNGKDKVVKANCNHSDIGNTLKICNQMLSTFRFLN